MARGDKKRGVTWAQASRDVVIKLITTGQLPLGIFGACLLLIIYKTPDADMPKVWDTVRLFINVHAGLGYLLYIPLMCGWYFHAKFQRRSAETELRRIAPERTKDQQQFFQQKLESTKG